MSLKLEKDDFFNFLKAYAKLRSISRVLSVKLSKSLYENSYHKQSRFMNDIQNLHFFLTFPSLYTQFCKWKFSWLYYCVSFEVAWLDFDSLGIRTLEIDCSFVQSFKI